MCVVGRWLLARPLCAAVKRRSAVSDCRGRAEARLLARAPGGWRVGGCAGGGGRRRTRRLLTRSFPRPPCPLPQLQYYTKKGPTVSIVGAVNAALRVAGACAAPTVRVCHCWRVVTNPAHSPAVPTIPQLTYKEGPLSGQAIIRGAYVNTASKARGAGRSWAGGTAAAVWRARAPLLPLTCVPPRRAQPLPPHAAAPVQPTPFNLVHGQDVGIDPNYHKYKTCCYLPTHPFQLGS